MQRKLKPLEKLLWFGAGLWVIGACLVLMGLLVADETALLCGVAFALGMTGTLGIIVHEQLRELSRQIDELKNELWDQPPSGKDSGGTRLT